MDPDGENGVAAVGGLIVESVNYFSGKGFNGANILGALFDGYNGEGQGFASAAFDDATTFIPVGVAIGVTVKYGGRFARTAVKKGNDLFGDARFVADSKGNIVDLKSTPKGHYTQPSGEKTDILQKYEHPGSGFSHTHIPGTKTTPKRIRPVSAEDVKNISSGEAVLKQKK